MTLEVDKLGIGTRTAYLGGGQGFECGYPRSRLSKEESLALETSGYS